MPAAELLFFFFAIALIYASVGFGGGSSYLAVLAIYGFSMPEMRLTALVCNVVVVTSGCLVFYRNGLFSWKKMGPLAVFSVPMAFIGASLKISERPYFLLLGSSLVVAAALLWFQKKEVVEPVFSPEKEGKTGLFAAAIGSAIGLLSGMVGIGGGIFLSPVLHFLRWDSARRIAATASFFILVNSVAGLAGLAQNGLADINWQSVFWLCFAVLAGGFIGSRLSVSWFSRTAILRLTAVLVLVAGIQVLWKTG